MTNYLMGWFFRKGNTTAHFYGSDQRLSLCGMAGRKASHFGQEPAVLWPNDYDEHQDGSKVARRCGACRQKLNQIIRKAERDGN